MEYFVIIIVAIISYLIGSVNFSIILSRAVSGKDIRESGSGNAGATNMLRTHGKKMGVITLLLDVLKGIAAILLAVLTVKLFLGGSTGDDATPDYSFVKYIAGVCVILGHNFPLYFGFKGGKGVATSLGVVLMLDWKAGLIVAVFALIIIVLTRYVSLGSILGGAAYILTELLTMDINKDIIRIICVIIIGGLLIIRHHANIMRLLNGTENKLGAKK